MNKSCTRCEKEKPLTEFYRRSGVNTIETYADVISECIDCMKERAKTQTRLPKTTPRVTSEIFAIEYLQSKGIPAVPGKAVSAADVDVVAFGCVWIDVKYDKEHWHRNDMVFFFSNTNKQIRDGYKGHIVMLICDHDDGTRTHHFFRPNHPVFYFKDGRRKTAFNHVKGRTKARKHWQNRTVMTQQMMDAAQDDVAMVWDTLKDISEGLKTR